MSAVPSPAALAILTAAAAKAASPKPVRKTFTFTAKDALELGLGASGVQQSGPSVILYDHRLVDDDGPGINCDAPLQLDQPPVFELAGNNRIKKILHVAQPDARGARLYLRPGAAIEFNGQRLDADPDNPYPEIPPGLLKDGDNEVILRSRGSNSLRVKAAARAAILRNAPEREDWPQRSFTSADGGKTWGPFDGEFMIRLHLDQYPAHGDFISPVLDLGKSAADDDPLQTPVSARSIKLTADAQTPAGTQIQYLIRSGSSPVYDAVSWSDWQSPQSPLDQGHRYLQWKAILQTSDPKITPVLHGVTVDAEVFSDPPPEWAPRIQSIKYDNPEIRYTAIPFAYEDPSHPKLAALRKKYRFDDIVAGSKTEFEKLVRLRHWVAEQWKWDPPFEYYPAWDADEILQGKKGFCVQFAIVYMQVAISMGYQTRFLFGNNPQASGGHEVCEVWSNEYKKWIYMDVADDYHNVDLKTGIPLSMLETHDLILKTYYTGKIASIANAPREKILSPDVGVCYGLEMTPSGKSPPHHREQVENGLYPVCLHWLQIRYMSRNNFVSQPYPVPMRQGFGWDWSDYYIWEGPQMPRQQWQYRHFTARRSDLEWTINQVRFDAACAAQPGEVRIQMGTVTPGLETFLINIDDRGWHPQDRQFAWTLHTGQNRIEMRVRTQAGIEGPISFLELDYQP